MTTACPRHFRSFLRATDDPRIAGIDRYDAVGFTEHAMTVPRIAALVNGWLERHRTEEFVGITCDGEVRAGCFPLSPVAPGEEAPVHAMVSAARALLERASGEERARLRHPLEARERRAWMNPELYVLRHGLRLDEVSAHVRDAVLDVVRASLSERGYAKSRALMRVNHFLGQLVNAPRVMNEFSYNFNLFGDPSHDGAWGWNLYGHHLCLNALVVDGHLAISPVFMGAEPNEIDTGPWAGTRVFDDEERDGLALMRSLPMALQSRAQLYRRKRDPAMPAGRIAVGDELNLAGAFRDNRVIPYEGVPAAQLDRARRDALVALVESYVSYLPDGPRRARMREVEAHLADTHFCWIGGTGDDDPFYYRIQSPVILVEFDHHAGVFLGNAEPERFHVHTIVRTPNGNDYGMAWVKAWCEACAGG